MSLVRHAVTDVSKDSVGFVFTLTALVGVRLL